jgi:hypothetical protein
MFAKLGLIGAPTAYYAYNKTYNSCEGSNQQSTPLNMAPPTPQSEAPKNEDDKSMEDLEKIFQENPYAAADPEEMERILQAKNKNKPRKPSQFTKLMIPIKMLTQCEKLDGLRFDVSGGLSEKFQLGGSWNFSNTKPSNFSLMAMFAPNMSPYATDGMNFINVKKDVLGKMGFVSNYHLTKSLSFKAEGFFPNLSENPSVEGAHLSYEIMKEFADWHLSYKFGGGSYSVSMMQSITSDLMGGFEAMWHPQLKEFIFNYGVKYTNDKHTFLAQYVPIAKKDAITIGYINRPSNKLNLFGELRASPEGFSESTFGFKLRFNSGQVTGTINSGYRMTSSIQVMMDAMLMTQLNTTMDLSKSDKPICFGVALSFGGGM